jgi:hypothetical protein
VYSEGECYSCMFSIIFSTSQLTSNIAFKIWIRLTDLPKPVGAMATPAS